MLVWLIVVVTTNAAATFGDAFTLCDEKAVGPISGVSVYVLLPPPQREMFVTVLHLTRWIVCGDRDGLLLFRVTNLTFH